MGGGGKRHANKDHRTLKRTINKGRWDDICANELRPERLPAVTKERRHWTLTYRVLSLIHI